VTARRRALTCGVVYVAILAALAPLLGTWTDEEYTLATTAHGVAYAWHRAITFEAQAPLYFAIVALLRSFDPAVWFARFFSVLCAAAFFALMLVVGRRVRPDRDPLPFALLAAANPFVVWAAFEIRLYALGLVLAALLWLAADEGFLHGESVRARVAFVVLGIVGLYTEYFLGFTFLAFGAALVAGRRWGTLATYVGALAIVGCAFLPLVPAIRSQLHSFPLEPEPPFRLAVHAALHPLLDFVFPRNGNHLRLPYAPLEVVVLAALAWLRPPRTVRIVENGLACAVILGCYVATSVWWGTVLEQRHYFALYPSVAIFAYAVVAAMLDGPERGRLAARAWLAIYVLLGAATLAVTYAPLSKVGDARRVAAFLAAVARPGDRIEIYPASAYPTYRRAYHGTIPLDPFPRPMRLDVYDVAALAVRDAAQAEAALRALGPGTHVWLVVRDPVTGTGRVLAGAAAAGTVIGMRRFYEADVLELRIGPGRKVGAQSPPHAVRKIVAAGAQDRER
jgi:hypothetical protein